MPQSHDTWTYRTFKLQIHAKIIESEQVKKHLNQCYPYFEAQKFFSGFYK